MQVYVPIRSVRGRGIEKGQVMPVATATVRVGTFIVMRVLGSQGLITRRTIPMVVMRNHHGKQRQDAGHQHHVLNNPLFHSSTHGGKGRKENPEKTIMFHISKQNP